MHSAVLVGAIAMRTSPPWRSRLLAAALALALGHCPCFPTDDTVEPAQPQQPFTFSEPFTERALLWEDTALLFSTRPSDMYCTERWWCLDGGSPTARRVTRGTFAHLRTDPCLSADGRTVFLWLDTARQLVAWDVATGAMESLTSLPRHVSFGSIIDPGFGRFLDPRPSRREQGIVEDTETQALYVVLQERTNERLRPWKRRDDRTGAHQILRIDPDQAPARATLADTVLPGLVSYWDIDPARGIAYLVVRSAEWYLDQQLVVTDLAGQRQRELPVPEERIRGLALSPDRSLLLVERWYEPPVEVPLHPTSESIYGGFLLMDPASGEVTDGPPRGRHATWSPDGRSVAYERDGEVLLYDVATGESRLLVTVDPQTVPLRRALIWSHDGRRLAVAGLSPRDRPGRPALLIDLEQREFVLLPGPAYELLWLPVPRPFGGA